MFSLARCLSAAVSLLMVVSQVTAESDSRSLDPTWKAAVDRAVRTTSVVAYLQLVPRCGFHHRDIDEKLRYLDASRTTMEPQLYEFVVDYVNKLAPLPTDDELLTRSDLPSAETLALVDVAVFVLSRWNSATLSDLVRTASRLNATDDKSRDRASSTFLRVFSHAIHRLVLRGDDRSQRLIAELSSRQHDVLGRVARHAKGLNKK